MPAKVLNKVDFPDPFSPIIANRSPRPNVKLTLFSASGISLPFLNIDLTPIVGAG